MRACRGCAGVVAACGGFDASCEPSATAEPLSHLRLRPACHLRPLSGVRDGSADEGDDVKRRLFTSLAAMSLLLCVATVALWVRSYWNGYEVCYHRGERLYETRATCGSFFISVSWYPAVTRSWEFYSDSVDVMSADRLSVPPGTIAKWLGAGGTGVDGL
jgi:hypothetical protein